MVSKKALIAANVAIKAENRILKDCHLREVLLNIRLLGQNKRLSETLVLVDEGLTRMEEQLLSQVSLRVLNNYVKANKTIDVESLNILVKEISLNLRKQGFQ